MNKFTPSRAVSTTLISLILITMTTSLSGQTREKLELAYDNVWGSLYNPEPEQCDNTPTITADGSVIDTVNASKQRWIAVSQDLLWSPRRHKLFVKDTINDNRYQGKLRFGDTIWIESPNPNINGKWVVHDLMNKKYRNAVDFLQTTGDGSLYNNDKLWDGKFKIISVYVINKNFDSKILKAPVPNLTNYVERPRPSQSIQIDSLKYFKLMKSIFTKDDLIRNHDRNVDNYWRLQREIDAKKAELNKIRHQIDSLEIELNKYHKENKHYHKMIRELEKKKR